MGQPGSAATDRRKAACRRQPGPLRAATKESVTMAKDILGEAGLYFDELNKLQVLDPEVTQQIRVLKCKGSMDQIGQFQEKHWVV